MPINSFKNPLKEYFSFTNRERKPIIILLFLLVLSLGVLAFLKFKTDSAKINISAFENEITAFENQLKQDSIHKAIKKSNLYPEKKVDPTPLLSFTLFDFDPNNLPDSMWLKLGVNEKTVKTIKKYESKGGKFFKKEDLKKIYGFDQKDFVRLEPFIVIPPKPTLAKVDTLSKDTAIFFKKPFKIIGSFDLNSVSAVELKTLYGIGDAKANSILKYRSMLGGYYVKEQLLEIYGVDSVLYESIKNNLDVKTKNLRPININTALEPDLKHPYISKQLATILVNYRKMHGNFKALEEIKKLPLVNDELYLKLAPYLSLN